MAYCWKEEFVVRDEDGEDLAWFDDFDGAKEYAQLRKEAVKVVIMRHYSTEYEDVWERAT